MVRRLGLMVALAVGLGGCASLSNMGLARTMNRGAVQGWVAPGGGGAVAINSSTSAAVGYPLIEGGVRYAVHDYVEIGGRLGLSGVAAEGKFALYRSPLWNSGFNLSLNPQIGFVGFGASSGSGGGGGFVGTLSFHLPILMGIDFGGHELVIGPRLIDQLLFGSFGTSSGSSGGVGNLLYLGGSIGFAIRASAIVRVMPEVSIGVPVFATAGGLSGGGFGGLIFQGGVGIIFGTSNQYEPPPPPLPPPPPPGWGQPAPAPVAPQPAPTTAPPPPQGSGGETTIPPVQVNGAAPAPAPQSSPPPPAGNPQ